MGLLRYKKTLIALLVVVVVAAAYTSWKASNKPTAANRVLPVTRGDIDITVLATGVVQPANRLEIKPPIPGRVEEVLVREGKLVRRGEILAWMSSSERAALIDAARAKGPEELQRWQELYRRTPIIAPIDGTIILRKAEPGQTFQSQDAVLVMSDRLIVRAQVDETDIGKVKLRQPARVTLDAYSDQPIDGVVDHIAFEARTVNNVITYEVDVLPARVPAFMRSGMTANVSFAIESRRNVVLVPAEAIQTRDGRTRVTVAPQTPDARPSERNITLGIGDGRRVEVLAGVVEGERVLAPQLASSGQAAPSSPLIPGRRR
ncbi:MAG: macrolide transporter [Candidatus Muproteobacteria bacterium RBG_16_60_9]|uniref:Macrolide transporter n=1 Tax=Candidatus Muproteobacteria bacterium RBG_16_60_9 TaxID=1817755 RepID=A0A1F6V036_9PROT|nr:MAG: macrolide transporter [Candidatus Muproteobacteria bacterium RBG_16_60_9]